MSASGLRARIVAQFRKPSGWAGRLAGWVMAHRASNVERNRRTVELIDIRPTDRVLEIGYGPGVSIAWAAERAPEGLVVGLDHSALMQDVATKRNARAIAEGRVRLRVGDIEAPPPLDGPFDKVLGVNVWMFWRDPAKTVAGLRALLSPGGTLALTYLPRHKYASSADTRSGGDRLTEFLGAAGLEDVSAHILPLNPIDAVCVLGHAPRGTDPDSDAARTRPDLSKAERNDHVR